MDEKPKKFIHLSAGDDYSIMGNIHFGRVSMPVAIPITLSSIMVVILFIVAVATLRSAPIVSAIAGSVVSVIVILAVLTLVIWGLVLLVRWMKNSIRVDRPGQ